MSKGPIAFLAMLCILLSAAFADTVKMVDGSSFENVDVHRYSRSEGFMARVPQDDGTMSDELYDIPIFRITTLEFRRIDDQGALPSGRPALLTTNDGQTFPGTIVETARNTQSGLVFRLREANAPIDAQAWDLPADQVQSLDFTAAAPAPAPTPFPGMEAFPLPMPGQGTEYTPPATFDQPDDSEEYDSEEGPETFSQNGEEEFNLEDMENMSAADLEKLLGVGLGLIIVITVAWALFEALINATILYLIARHFNLDCPFWKDYLTGLAIVICTNISSYVVSSIIKLGGCSGCIVQLALWLTITRLLIMAILKQEKSIAWQMTLGVLLARILLCLGLATLIIFLAGASAAVFSSMGG